MVPVMERADELWENEFARVIVKNHAQFKLAADVARKNMAEYAYDMSGSLMDCMDTALAIACNEVKGEVEADEK